MHVRDGKRLARKEEQLQQDRQERQARQDRQERQGRLERQLRQEMEDVDAIQT